MQREPASLNGAQPAGKERANGFSEFEAAKRLFAVGKGCTQMDKANQEMPPSLARARWRGALESEIRKAVKAFGLTMQQWREG